MTAKHTRAAARGLMQSEFARNKRELMGLINQIRSTGAAVEIDLPTIVVAGNQSSGKSSLIEAISGINLPRADGTCTRVPIEVRLRSDEDGPWQCVVKIRREATQDTPELDADSRKPELDFGEPLTDPESVEKVIRRAQLAILNPHQSPDKFVDYEVKDGERGSISFSRSVVVLDISGPDLTDLTLVDLPGIFSSVSKDEDAKQITFVEDLVKSYISKDCLILLVITTKDDIENQKAVMLARHADPEGKRTIGVLTKVDTLRGLENERWVKVLRGEREQLLHGYFATRQPNLDELSAAIPFEEARAKEISFFEQTRPWNENSSFKDRLGTANLSAALSTHLLHLIQQKMPSVIDQINKKYSSITKELEALGNEPSTEPVREMLDLITKFVKVVEDQTAGDRDKTLIQKLNSQYESYGTSVWHTRPHFMPFTSAELEKKELEDDFQWDAFGDMLELAEGLDEEEEYIDEDTVTLDMVREEIHKARSRELPNNVPPAAKKALILQYTSDWGGCAEDLLTLIKPIMRKHLESACREVFGRYEHGDLPASVDDIIAKKLNELAKNTRALLTKMVELESQPFTLNTHYITDVKAEFLTTLLDQRHPKVQSNEHQEKVRNTLAGLNTLGYSGVTEDDLAKLRPTDPWQTELEVMAEVRAYWQVAFKRIIDNVPRIIDNEFIRPASQVLNDALIASLKLSTTQSADLCAKWLAESPLVAEKRIDLSRRRDVLKEARKTIRERRFGKA